MRASPARHRPRDGGTATLIDVLTRQSKRLNRLAVGLGMTAAEAEDVVQDVSVQALKYKHLDLTDREATAWLVRTTANRCKLEHRKHKRRQRFDRALMREILPALNESRPAGTDAIQSEHVELLNETLGELREELLVPLVLRYFCDMTSSEVGHTLNLKPSAVRSRLQEARLSLARTLIKRGFIP